MANQAEIQAMPELGGRSRFVFGLLSHARIEPTIHDRPA